MNLFASTLLSLLPKSYRGGLAPYDVPSQGALVSGLLEVLIGLGLVIHGYFSYTNARMAALPAAVFEEAGKRGESGVMGLGTAFLFEYALQLTTLMLLFMVLEGVARALAAVGNNETLPSFPLYLLSWLHGRFDSRQAEKMLGPRIQDEVQRAGDGATLQIASCRPKPWNQLTTISHEDELYELAAEHRRTAPRQFVYVLRKKPPSTVIRGIYYYSPDEALEPNN